MYRKDLIDLLLDTPRSVHALAEQLGQPVTATADDLRHLFRSLRNTPYRAVIEPARCRSCDFAFRTDKITRPGRCPRCKGSWISEPLIRIER